jgi:hypothetical protein
VVHDEKRNGASKCVAYAGKQAENSVPAKADVGARNQELFIHSPGEELNLVEALPGRHSSGQPADEISGCGAAGPASRIRNRYYSFLKGSLSPLTDMVAKPEGSTLETGCLSQEIGAGEAPNIVLVILSCSCGAQIDPLAKLPNVHLSQASVIHATRAPT